VGADGGGVAGDTGQFGGVGVTSDKIQAMGSNLQPASNKPVQFHKKQVAQCAGLWMRAHYSFAGLRNLVALLKEYPQGLRPMELNRIVYQRELIRTKRGKMPSPTTLYHYRRALLKLGIVKRQGRNLVIASDDALVAKLVDSLSDGPGLSPEERHIFADIVLRNSECRRHFFDFFMPDDGLYDRMEFVSKGVPVIWQALPGGKRQGAVFLNMGGETIREITTEVEVQAILYGLRYWARDELLLIDELFREDTGNLMFPIREPGTVREEVIRRAILSEIAREREWTLLSVRDLIYKWAVRLRVPIAQVFDVINQLYRENPGHVALVATPRSLATLTTVSSFREDFELRSYLRDESGRCVSHIRFHRQLREEIHEGDTTTSGSSLQSL